MAAALTCPPPPCVRGGGRETFHAASSRSAFSRCPVVNSFATSRLISTVTRSANVRMVSGSVDSTRTATPLSRSDLDDADHVLLGADIHAARRLRQDQHLRQMRQPFGQRHLLLVAARKIAERDIGARRADLQVLDVLFGDRAFPTRFQQPAMNAAENGDRDVLENGLGAEQHHAAVLRHEGDAGARAAAVERKRTGLPSSDHPPRRAGPCRTARAPVRPGRSP
jgi:hypothetical protein